jgi:sulfur carrier protein
MELTINGKTQAIDRKPPFSIKDVLEELGHGSESEGKAVAVNDEVVPSSEWSDRVLNEGDRMEVIQAVQGG